MVVDVNTSRVYVFEHRDGDRRTPVRGYFITGKISSGALPNFYGPDALPVNYPSECGPSLGRAGYGTGVHSVPSNTYSRVPYESDECGAVANADFGLFS